MKKLSIHSAKCHVEHIGSCCTGCQEAQDAAQPVELELHGHKALTCERITEPVNVKLEWKGFQKHNASFLTEPVALTYCTIWALH